MNATAKALLAGVVKQIEKIYENRPGLFLDIKLTSEWLVKEDELVKNVRNAKGATQMRVHTRKFVTEFKAACSRFKKVEKPRLNRAGDPAGTIYPIDGGPSRTAPTR